MRKYILAGILATVPMLFAPQAKAQSQITTDNLAKWCQVFVDDNGDLSKASSPVLHATCISYVAGWMSGIGGMSLQTKTGYQTVIFAENVTAEQVVRVFVKFVHDNPKYLNQTAVVSLAGALFDAKLLGLQPAAPQPTEN